MSPHAAPPQSADMITSSSPSVKPPSRDALARLFQCRLCSSSLRDPVTLPCGKSLCRSCLPESHDRVNITYPATPERTRRLRCPFSECAKDHALSDCNIDVVLSKLLDVVRDYLPGYSSKTTSKPAKQESEEKADDDDDDDDDDDEPMRTLQTNARGEMDCQVCYGLFCDPLTTACGHTFCRSCLQRILDHARHCPICRRDLPMNPLLNPTACPTSERLGQIIDSWWPDELLMRRDTLAADKMGDSDFDVALFVCTLAFPMMPTFLHVFEPRYRLMIRRALDGDRTFGMLLPRRPRFPGDPAFYELGTLLRIINVHFYPDGRSLIEARGVSRFRVVRHSILDGYAVGKTERVDDISIEEEEASEASEACGASLDPEARRDNNSTNGSQNEGQQTPLSARVATMSTCRLVESSLEFVARMRSQSAPWLTDSLLSVYGKCPTDPALLPWWMGSMLPVHELEKYRLLGTSSVRDRMKICYSWIVEWESSPWSLRPGCTIL